MTRYKENMPDYYKDKKNRAAIGSSALSETWII